MSAASVLGSMAEPRRCKHTGLTIPECCCRRCCEALLRRYAPWLLRRGPESSPALWSASDFAQPQHAPTAQLHDRPSREEIPA